MLCVRSACFVFFVLQSFGARRNTKNRTDHNGHEEFKKNPGLNRDMDIEIYGEIILALFYSQQLHGFERSFNDRPVSQLGQVSCGSNSQRN